MAGSTFARRCSLGKNQMLLTLREIERQANVGIGYAFSLPTGGFMRRNLIQAPMSRYDLTDFEWRVIEPLLPNKPRGVAENQNPCSCRRPREADQANAAAGQKSDITSAVDLIRDLARVPCCSPTRVANALRAAITGRKASANIPPKSNRKGPICFSPFLYKARNLVERFFNKAKQFRRIGTRYDKLAENYLAALNSSQLASGYAVMSPRPSMSRLT